MVAINSSRRRPEEAGPVPAAAPESALHAIAAAGASSSSACSTRRAGGAVAVVRDRRGVITQVRIGRWRTLASSPQRQVTEVRELACQRVAVRIERISESSGRASSEIWQLYDAGGRLDAAMQTTPDGRFALLTNYRTRQACRLAANAQGVLETVETWAL